MLQKILSYNINNHGLGVDTLKTFKRGIHPDESKQATENEPIKYILPGEHSLMLYPVAQNLGAPCEPIVEVGQYVKNGEKIADSQAFVSSPVHSTVSGTVKEIRDNVLPNGNISKCIVVENDGLLTEHESIKERAGFDDIPKDELLKIIREAGIVGLGGAGFPTHVKLSPPAGKKIDYIIVNGSECEPYLTTDNRVMIEETYKIILGLQIILKIIDTAKGVIAIEDNKPEAIAAVKKAIDGAKNISVEVVKTKYPQGAEKQLIYAITGREVPSGGLPADAGAIVDNVDTVIAIHRAVLRGRPLMRKVITITGQAVNKPGNFKARLGMSYRELIEVTGGFKTEPVKIISGGPMMGVAMYTLDTPVIKTSSAIICMTDEEAYIPPETACIRCGQCVANCPSGLMPLELNKFVLHGRIDEFLKYNGLDCCECGSCSYVCPAKRHLAQTIRVTRRSEMAKKARK